ncbi:MAG TPA: acyltransferase [Lichenihabitans sp.]|nr:acyltransferase [Lichenihabitans sp.]
MGSRPAPLYSIQVLRAFAALSVVVHHAGYDADTIAGRYGDAPLGLDRLFDWSFGIHLFFVISGFIMLRTARDFGRPGAPPRFVGRRLLRIAPLYWLMTTAVLLGSLAAPGLLNVPVEGWGLFFGSYLFIPVTRINGEIRPILGQGWTLDYEMFFYLLFGAAMALPRRAGLSAIAVVLIGLVLLGKIFPAGSAPLFVWTNGLLLEFLLGIAIGLLGEVGWRIGRASGIALVLLGLLAAVALGPASSRFEAVDPVLRGGLPAALILAGSVLMPPWRASRLVLGLAILGDASYSLYLAHPFAIRLLRVGWTATVGNRLPAWVFLCCACLAAVITGLVVFRLIEAPMTARLNRLFPAMRHRSPDSTARSPV